MTATVTPKSGGWRRLPCPKFWFLLGMTVGRYTKLPDDRLDGNDLGKIVEHACGVGFHYVQTWQQGDTQQVWVRIDGPGWVAFRWLYEAGMFALFLWLVNR